MVETRDRAVCRCLRSVEVFAYLLVPYYLRIRTWTQGQDRVTQSKGASARKTGYLRDSNYLPTPLLSAPTIEKSSVNKVMRTLIIYQ